MHERIEACEVMGQTSQEHVKQHIDKYAADYMPRFHPDPSWTEITEAVAIPATWKQWLGSLLRDGRWLCGETLPARKVPHLRVAGGASAGLSHWIAYAAEHVGQ